jgi:uncharacterized membrane protein YcaP (DUF421 family)
MHDIYFQGWHSILRVMLMSGITYVLVISLLRVFGSQALAKMSAYDLIVTITLGSLVANIALSTDYSISDGFAAVLTFLVLQQATRILQKRFKNVHHLVRERPRLLVWDGRFIPKNLEYHKVTEDEVRAAIRRTGLLSLTQVQGVVLENDGEWAVMSRSDAVDLSALHGIHVPGRADEGHEDEAGDEWPPGQGPKSGESAGKQDGRQTSAASAAQPSPV